MNLLVIDVFQNLIDLTKNGILLFGLALIYAAINFNPDTERKAKKILAGLVIGIFAMLVMMNPWQVDEGLYFDTRSVLMGVTGLFFGPLTTIIAGTLAIIYRISLGGLGIYSGVLTILATGSIGLYWFKIKKIIRIKNKYLEYYIFGFIIHFVAILCFLAIPWPQAFEIITYTALPFLVIFPVFTMILALVIENQKDRLTAHNHLKKNQQLLQASIDAAQNIEIYALDTDYRYLSLNQFHYNSMRKHYGVSIKKESNFLSIIENLKMKERIKNGLDEALLGRALKKSFEVETTPGKHFEELYQPIYDDHFHVTGVTVFSQDITERVKYEESILHISYHDAMTSERPYRGPMTHEAAIKEIESNAGTQFDPKIARIFIDSFKKQKTKASP
ncbi:MAG: hypothetical protein IH571_04675 [Acholeplasmataceae bacterium]|nr:hypothetical protein [Acholeplasmataceae bacterium]